jgi:hypothetical protein
LFHDSHISGQRGLGQDFFSAELEVLTTVFMKSSISLDIALSSVETQVTFQAALLATCFMLVSSLAYSSTLKMDMFL